MEPIKIPQQSAQMPEQEIKVMPDKYIGASLRAQPKQTEKIVVVEKVKVVEKNIPAAPVSKAKKRGLPKWPIAALLLVLLSGGSAFYYVSTLNVPAPAPPLNITPPPPVEVIPPPSEEIPPPPAVEETGPKKGADADSDGLTDAEELMYGSNRSNPDSDNDGFLDGVETFHLYNPAGQAPVRLLDTGSVKVYINPSYKYQIYVPSSWTIEPSSSGSEVKFVDGAESVTVKIENNPSHLPLVNWYLSNHPEAKPADLQTFITKSNLDGVKGLDGLTAYIASDGSVYAITYNLGPDKTVNYRITFEMMLNSFVRMQ